MQDHKLQPEYRMQFRSIRLEPAPGVLQTTTTNTFARESQIDIMASAAGIDPLEFRLKNLKDEKMIACWKAVADKFGYVAAKSPAEEVSALPAEQMPEPGWQ